MAAMKILTHPDNVELLKQMFDAGALGGCVLCVEPGDRVRPPPLEFQFTIHANRYLERDQPTGRYVLPCGRAVPRAEVVIPEGRFFEWGGPDMSDVELNYLLSRGLLREEREPLFYILNDVLLRSDLSCFRGLPFVPLTTMF